MTKTKIFRDPIYGYIEIPVPIVRKVVDTPAFQRLRRIIQTSYSPLYSSALHNRFVHSLGVYHLGCMVGESLVREMKNITDDHNWVDKYRKIFELACLLHDVGHAPFSHTGEKNYLHHFQGYGPLHRRLNELIGKNISMLVGEKERSSDNSAAPHELMSAIISLKEYDMLKNDEDVPFLNGIEEKEFFARCITGYRYNDSNLKSQLKNCFVSMLNSNIIDVDKLDYLLRDKYTTGFTSADIDYVRLLKSVIISEKDGMYFIAYNKRALSVIENVVYARDSQKKWIQSHPTILYESYLLDQAFKIIIDLHKDNNLFSEDSLSENGIITYTGHKVKLLCDDDIISMMKQCNDPIISEYFDRRLRRHPMFKSEAEYRDIYDEYIKSGELKSIFHSCMKEAFRYLLKNKGVINIDTLNKLNDHIGEIESGTKMPDKGENLEYLRKVKKVMIALQEFATERKIDYDFLIIPTSQFKSGFGKEDFAKLPIEVDKREEKPVCRNFGDIVTSLHPNKSLTTEFYYIFYRRSEDNWNAVEEGKYDLRDKVFKAIM